MSIFSRDSDTQARAMGEDDRTGSAISPEPLLVLFAALLALFSIIVAWTGRPRVPEIRIFFGFYLFFIAPGWMFKCILFPSASLRIFERIPIAVALTLGVWAFPGILAYRYEWDLSTVATVELSLIVALAVLALTTRSLIYFLDLAEPPVSKYNTIAILAITLALAAFAGWTGAFRGTSLDWDYYNYIGAINKLVAWGKASIAHYAYIDAPPDPIHSYNIWALQWALVSKFFKVGPIELYVRSAFITVPIAALAFYALAARIIGPLPARTALLLYVAYHVLCGGLLFLGRTTFYPADSMWLIVFPACMVLFLMTIEVPNPSCLLFFEIFFGLALAVLGMSVVHVLWGLCFYIAAGALLCAMLLDRFGLWAGLRAAWQSGRKPPIVASASLAAVPLLAMLIGSAVMAFRHSLDGFTPLLGGGNDLSPWTYAMVFLLLPGLWMLSAVWPYRKYKGRAPGLVIFLVAFSIAACAMVALPYIAVRSGVVASTDWSQFGRNPYRAFLTANLFFLNPFQLSLDNPNMTFYPLYILGYLAIPLLWMMTQTRRESKGMALFAPAIWKSRPRNYGALMALAVLMIVPFICFNPVTSTLFADLFSLGYLRRLLRLSALFSVLPAALALHALASLITSAERRPVVHIAIAAALSLGIAWACTLFPASPSYYNDLLHKTVTIAEHAPKDSLIADDTPYRAIEDNHWFGDSDVLFSDLWTSYRLTAYLPQFTAVREKPGTGVADQDERIMLEREFFDTRTSLDRMREILEHFKAAGVIVNRNPGYRIYSYNCGHPEAVGKLKSDPRHFQLLYDKGDWAIFRIREQAGAQK